MRIEIAAFSGVVSFWSGIRKEQTNRKPGDTPTEKKRNLLSMLKSTPEKDQKEVLGSAVKALTTSTKLAKSVVLGRVKRGLGVQVKIGKEKEQPLLTLATFRKIEVDTDMARNSLLKLKRILSKEIPVEKM